MTPKAEQVAAVRAIVAEIMADLGLGFDDVRLILTGRRPVRELPGRSVAQIQQRINRGRQDVERIPRREPTVREPINPGTRPRGRA